MGILDAIKLGKEKEVAHAKTVRKLSGLEQAIKQRPPPREFVGAVAERAGNGTVALIAEIKKASPSKGLIRSDFQVAAIAEAYRDGGAACLSVLTDQTFFQGKPADLELAKAVSGLPVLRKDFMIDPYQVHEARAMGADAILLILAMLDHGQAIELEAAAQAMGMGVLIEIHDEPELERAMAMQSRLIGINNRDLATFAADLTTSERLASKVDRNRIVISESGIGGHGDVIRLMEAGINGFLIGEQLLRARHIESATREIAQARLHACP
ncbi:indole-3-glycerol-phosphate synthase (plasmid) [Ralstonia solanacearum]|uniref:indole-3-glycerol phosphate synthase TrpC n=1 Tax=Ralstonia pseudosolanacearum TaxID=1310165 RepID=UPI000E57F79D|nr:indole-3-glycerol-phosphate synthase [Ralstonia solanacearum]AXW40624.1 indole-3-glycerol-phosphate synthase [Ralstonia solanacearum]AXW73421.1 indole-3-glycerol-phosphate synthase [Ralstonia solanacearum]BEU69461.1 indole-3-glycerol phosphate synthase TrpC [Ralstonia pseudosolanacearum]